MSQVEQVADIDAIVWVTAYSVTRNYGGPEEGGWWYDWYEALETVPVTGTIRAFSGTITGDAVDLAKEALKEKWGHAEYGRSRYSVNGGADLVVSASYEPAEWASKERPRYS